MGRPGTQGQNDFVPELVQQIVEAVRPLRIVLFGSAARGDLERHRDNIGLVHRAIAEEGRIVYAAPRT